MEERIKYPYVKKEIIGNCTLYLGDSLDIYPIIKNIDAIITDPPYGINHDCNFNKIKRGKLAKCNDYSNVIGDDEPFDPKWILDFNLPTILWGANYFCDKLPISNGWLVWDKLRPDTLDQATCELAWTNYVKGVRRFTHLWNGMMRASEKGENYHPTQKPVALYDWIFSLVWSKGLNVIFDPYMGSGPCGVSAIKNNKKYIGIEKDEHYFNISCERIAKETMTPWKYSNNKTALFEDYK
jgi:site-specific DNA-methyltransferase (adenine-specific)/modification methylase